MACPRRSPAAVGATLRVVRVNRRMSQALLKGADRLAERRLGHPELCRGPREAAFARHGDERQQVVEVAPWHTPNLLRNIGWKSLIGNFSIHYLIKGVPRGQTSRELGDPPA